MYFCNTFTYEFIKSTCNQDTNFKVCQHSAGFEYIDYDGFLIAKSIVMESKEFDSVLLPRQIPFEKYLKEKKGEEKEENLFVFRENLIGKFIDTYTKKK